jgi:hypothetical protein
VWEVPALRHFIPRRDLGYWLSLLALLVASNRCHADDPLVKGYWAIDDIKEGMQGYGRTVMRGTRIERFEAEVLGVQRSVSPGRDMVLMRLRGCELEKTGIIAGMSGSPIYVDGKLLGAVAFAWPFGKEPIAGVTPFCQMVSFAANLEAQYRADMQQTPVGTFGAPPARSGLSPMVRLWDEPFRSFFASGESAPGGAVLGMGRIRMPLVASGFSPRGLAALGDAIEPMGMLPVMGGELAAAQAEQAAEAPWEPGSPLSIALVTGDFDLSGIGTVTHIEGDRVYGFGHPMFAIGKCEFPLQSGYIHTVYPRQSVSFKLGSPIRTLGTIEADVSTCVAGRMGRRPVMVPMEVVVKRAGTPTVHKYNVQVIRQPELLASMVFQVLTAAIDTEGNLPDELTLKFDATIQPKGRRAFRVSDIYSGEFYAGATAPMAVYNIVPQLLNALVRNPYSPVEIDSIRCTTEISEGRAAARIAAIKLDAELYEPGDKLTATVQVEPHKGAPRHIDLSIALPANLPSGVYPVLVCDSMTSIRADLRNQPHLMNPENLDQLDRVLSLQIAERRTNLYLRVQTRDLGVAVQGTALPELPASMAQILTSRRRSGALPIRNELVARRETPWVLQGGQMMTFQVVQDKKLYK